MHKSSVELNLKVLSKPPNYTLPAGYGNCFIRIIFNAILTNLLYKMIFI